LSQTLGWSGFICSIVSLRKNLLLLWFWFCFCNRLITATGSCQEECVIWGFVGRMSLIFAQWRWVFQFIGIRQWLLKWRSLWYCWCFLNLISEQICVVAAEQQWNFSKGRSFNQCSKSIWFDCFFQDCYICFYWTEKKRKIGNGVEVSSASISLWWMYVLSSIKSQIGRSVTRKFPRAIWG
jgi:hypothetical protein